VDTTAFNSNRWQNPFEIDIVSYVEAPVYQKLAGKSNKLYSLGMNYNQIAKIFKVDKTTIRKAVLCFWRIIYPI
jgi:hypothetical protein